MLGLQAPEPDLPVVHGSLICTNTGYRQRSRSLNEEKTDGKFVLMPMRGSMRDDGAR